VKRLAQNGSKRYQKDVSVTSSLRITEGQLLCEIDSRSEDGSWLKGQTYVLAKVEEGEEIGRGRFANAVQEPQPDVARFAVYNEGVRLPFHGQVVVDWIAENTHGPWTVFVAHEGRQILVEFQFALAADAVACKLVHG
jgi:hypothetical protein